MARTDRAVEPSHDSIDLGASGAHDDDRADDDDGGGLLTSPWLWIGVGIVVAGGVTVAVAMSASGGEPDLYRGSLGPGAVTFE